MKMSIKRLVLNFVLIIGVFCWGTLPQLQAKELTPEASVKRDPFIPLVDDNGKLRKSFEKPVDANMIPQVSLAGISKINKVFYAVIDGEWVKEGDTIKDLMIEKIEPNKVILKFGNRTFELNLDKEEK